MMLRETCWLIHFVTEGDLTRIHVKVGWRDDHVWQLREVIFLSYDDHGSLALTVSHYLRRRLTSGLLIVQETLETLLLRNYNLF